MFEAQTLMATGTEYSVYSPWFPKGANNLRASLELVKAAASADSIKLEVATKNVEDSGDGTDVSGSITITGSQVGTANQRQTTAFMGVVKEMVRYKFTVSGSSGNWVLFRALPPVWFDDVSTS